MKQQNILKNKFGWIGAVGWIFLSAITKPFSILNGITIFPTLIASGMKAPFDWIVGLLAMLSTGFLVGVIISKLFKK